MNRKVVDLTTSTTFTKARRCFSQWFLQERLANFECRSVFGKQELLAVEQVFHQFPLKI
jgi:hypothetical protein